MSCHRHLVMSLRAVSRHALLALCVAGIATPAWAGKDEVQLAERVTKLERALNGSGLLELSKQIEALQLEVRQLRGDLENQAFTLEQARKAQRDAYADNDRRLSALEQGGAAGNAGMPADPPVSTIDSPTDTAVAGKPSEEAMAVEMQRPATRPRTVAPSQDAIDVSEDAAANMQPGAEHPTMVLSPNDPPPGGMSVTPSQPSRIARHAVVNDDAALAPPAAHAGAGARGETP